MKEKLQELIDLQRKLAEGYRNDAYNLMTLHDDAGYSYWSGRADGVEIFIFKLIDLLKEEESNNE